MALQLSSFSSLHSPACNCSATLPLRPVHTDFSDHHSCPKISSRKKWKRSLLSCRSSSDEGNEPTYQVIQHLNADPFMGSPETLVTSRPLIAWHISNLPGYRTTVNPVPRGVEIGLAHGYLLVGPFVITGLLRSTDIKGPAGSLAGAGLVVM